MPRTTERFAPAVHHRTELAAFDHDCPGGHGPGCAPVSVDAHEEWRTLDGQLVTDPEYLAFLEERRLQQQGG